MPVGPDNYSFDSCGARSWRHAATNTSNQSTRRRLIFSTNE
jgi:hypothetical protein